MGLKPSEIRRVVEAFDASDWDEIHISDGETELHLVAAGVTPRTSAAAPREPVDVTRPVTPAPVARPAPTATPAPAPAAAAPPTGHRQVVDPDAVAVLAPSMGVLYRAPSPGAPPFVEVGDVVEAGTTVCIVEVMKLMNPVQAGVAGTVVGIHVANADRVVSGQTLFTIAPAG